MIKKANYSAIAEQLKTYLAITIICIYLLMTDYKNKVMELATPEN